MGFTKLDDGLAQSSIVTEDDAVFKVWILILSLTGADGIARVSSTFLASVTRKTDEEVERCLKVLESPDRRSRSQVEDGRRVVRIDGGYRVVNHGKYREFSYSQNPEAVRKRAYRSGHTEGHSGTCPGHSASASASSSASSVVVSLRRESVRGEEFRENENVKAVDPVERFHSVFNAVFGRRVSLLAPVRKKAEARLKDFDPWQLIVLPLLVEAQGFARTPEIRRKITPEILLRDGKHGRTTKEGYTCGATDWMERSWLIADQTVLDARLTSIAEQLEEQIPGILDNLTRFGVKLTRGNNGKTEN